MATLCENCRLINLDLHGERAALTRLQLEEDEDNFASGRKLVLKPVEFTDGSDQKLPLLDADGLLLSRNISPDVLDRCHGFRARRDDILLATYPKCGTHWVNEILNLLVEGRTSLHEEYSLKSLEYSPLSVLEGATSPRVLATHMPFSRVPRDLLTRGCKTVWVTRNPWDVAVSMFHFLRNLKPFDYDSDWKGFFELFLDGHVPFGSYFDHTQEWLRAMASHDILMVRYEDLHENFKYEVQRMADFLGTPVTAATLEAMERETSFQNMATKKSGSCITNFLSKTGKSILYRKGQCGDWRNYFTEDQCLELRGAYRVSLGPYNGVLNYASWSHQHPEATEAQDDGRGHHGLPRSGAAAGLAAAGPCVEGDEGERESDGGEKR